MKIFKGHPDYKWEYEEQYKEWLKTVEDINKISLIEFMKSISVYDEEYSYYVNSTDFEQRKNNSVNHLIIISRWSTIPFISWFNKKTVTEHRRSYRNTINTIIVGYDCLFDATGNLRIMKVKDTKGNIKYISDGNEAYLKVFKDYANKNIVGYNTRRDIVTLPIHSLFIHALAPTFNEIEPEYCHNKGLEVLAKLKEEFIVKEVELVTTIDTSCLDDTSAF